jgi:hypothetical protein
MSSGRKDITAATTSGSPSNLSLIASSDSNQYNTTATEESPSLPPLPQLGALLVEAYDRIVRERPVTVSPQKLVYEYIQYLVRIVCWLDVLLLLLIMKDLSQSNGMNDDVLLL